MGIEIRTIQETEGLETSEGAMKPLVFGKNLAVMHLLIPAGLEVPPPCTPRRRRSILSERRVGCCIGRRNGDALQWNCDACAIWHRGWNQEPERCSRECATDLVTATCKIS